MGCAAGWAQAVVHDFGILVGFIFRTFQLGNEKKINVKPHSSDFKHRGCAELGVSRIFTVLRQDDRCLLQIINKRLSVGKKIHKDKTNNEIVFIEENEAGTQAQNKFVVY